MQDFSHHEGEPFTTWLIQCWGKGADSLNLDSKGAMQLWSLARDGGIEKATGGKAENQSLWRQFLPTVKSRCPYKTDIVCHLSLHACLVHLVIMSMGGLETSLRQWSDLREVINWSPNHVKVQKNVWLTVMGALKVRISVSPGDSPQAVPGLDRWSLYA